MLQKRPRPLKPIRDGNELINRNCWDYLHRIAEAIPEDIDNIIKNLPPRSRNHFLAFRNLRRFIFAKQPIPTRRYSHFEQLSGEYELSSGYRPKARYGNSFYKFMRDLENAMPEIMRVRKVYLENTSPETLKARVEYLEKERIVSFRAEYLKNLKAKNKQSEDLTKAEEDLAEAKEDLAKAEEDCKEQTKNLRYHQFLTEDIEKIIKLTGANPNRAVQRSYHMIKDVIKPVSHNSTQAKEVVNRRMRGNSTSFFGKLFDDINYYFSYREGNKWTPQVVGGRVDRFLSMISPNYKPQRTTSLSSVRKFKYQEELEKELPEIKFPTEIRRCTQAQYHEGKARVSPLFKAELEILKDPDAPNKITYVYFNYLDRTDKDNLLQFEPQMSQQLENLETEHTNVAVISLPGRHGLVGKNCLGENIKQITFDEAKEKILSDATSNDNPHFYISPNIKDKLFNEVDEQTKMNELLQMSFEKLGIKPDQILHKNDFRAVYFHFINFELSDYILTKLNPINFNRSCKNGIDRGNAASIYYHLIRSIEAEKPMKSEEEFLSAVMGPATMAQGRPMNKQCRLLWKAINVYINAPANQDKVPEWLRKWRDKNVPKGTKEYYIKELNNYIKTHNNQQSNPFSIFTNDYIFSNQDKSKVASKILNALKNSVQQISFTRLEWLALQSSDTLCRFKSAIEKKGLANFHENIKSATRYKFTSY